MNSTSSNIIQVLMPNLPEYFEENEFLLRELDIKGKKINHDENAPLPRNSVLYCNNLEHWQKRLMLSEASTITVIIATNEYYKSEKWLEVNRITSIKCAFIQYLPSNRRTKFGSIIKFITHNPKYLSKKVFWQTSRDASRTYLEMRRMKFCIPVFGFPLGYSDRFVIELKNLGLMPGETISLYEKEIYDKNLVRHSVSFIGQKGRWYRRLMVEYFERIAGASTSMYGSFGGFTHLPQTTDYVSSILSSKFVVCPPGNVSSQSFRYYEAIALGAVPIVTEVSLQDWNTHEYWPRDTSWKYSNFMDVWLSLKDLDGQDLDSLITELRFNISDQFSKTRALLRLCMEHDEAPNERV
ncbi:hypothetical protein MCEORE3_00051 [Candidatus Nanopelagicaceae bacterium]